MPVETPTITPVRTPYEYPDPDKTLSPDKLCPSQKQKIVREIERII